MARQTINIGTSANARNGDPIRTAFQKVNENFTELYNTTAPAGGLFTVDTVDLHNGGTQSAQLLQFTNTGLQSVITGPTPDTGNTAQRLIIQGQRATGFGEGGDVYLWSGDSEVAGGDIKIYAGDADSNETGSGGYINIDAGRGFSSGGYLGLSAGDANGANGYGGNVNISAGQAYDGTPGNISLTTFTAAGANYTWYFGNDGKIQLPVGGDIVDSNGTSVLGSGSTGNTIFSGNGIGNSDGVNVNDIVIAPNWDGQFTGNTYLTLRSNENASGAVQLVNNNTGGIQLITQNDATWTFGANGSLTFPGGMAIETTYGGGPRLVIDGTTEYVDIRSTSTILIGYNNSSGNVFIGDPEGGGQVDIVGPKFRVFAEAPTTSTGKVGDQSGQVAFDNSYIYHCIADYNQLGHQVTVAADYLGRTALNTNSFQLTKTSDTLQIAVGDIISDSNGGGTSIVDAVTSDDNYTYVLTGAMAYNAVFPLTFTSTDYVAGGNIWKRVAWSADTW